MRLGDKPLWGIIAAFVAWEFYAHFVRHNVGSHTLSNDIGRFERWAGPAGEILVVVVCLGLLAHLLHERWG